MRKPTVDYRSFRLSKLNTPEFSHLKLLFGWVTGGIWWLVDIFLTYRRAKVKNFENIAAALRAATPPPMQAPPPVQR